MANQHTPSPLFVLFNKLPLLDIISCRGVCRSWKQAVGVWFEGVSELSEHNLSCGGDFVCACKMIGNNKVVGFSTRAATSCLPEMRQFVERHNNSLKTIDLTCSALGAAHIVECNQILSKPTNLTKLVLHDNGLGANELSLLCCGAFRLLSSLTHLDLSRNFIAGEEGGRVLGKIVSESFLLKHLDLSHNSLGDDGAVAFAPAIRGCYLAHLNVSFNFISSRGATSLAIAVGDSQIETFNIVDNPVGLTGTNAVLQCVRVNKNVSVAMDFTHSDDLSGSDNDSDDGNAPLLG